MHTKAPEQDEEVGRLRGKLAEAERQLETQKKCIESLRRKVARFPEQKKRAIQKALHRSKLHTHASWSIINQL